VKDVVKVINDNAKKSWDKTARIWRKDSESYEAVKKALQAEKVAADKAAEEAADAKRKEDDDEHLASAEPTRADASSSGGGPGAGWEGASGPGYKVLYKYDGSTGEVEVVANITLDVEPLKLWTLLREFDLMPTWHASFKDVDLEASFASQCDFYHSQNKAIVRGVMNPTESYIERTYVDALAEHGRLVVVGQCPQQSASQHCGMDIPPAPRNVNRVVATTCDVVTPMSEKQVMLTSHRKLKTPVRHLPQWVVRQAASILTNGNLASFQKALESWDDSDFAERLRSGQRAEYYAQLRQQLLASTRA